MELKYDFNKERFFNTKPKEVDMKNMKCINASKNLSKKDKEFLMNKEKNEKNMQKNIYNFDTQPENKN
jgi:hypothetical protein